MLLIKGVKNDFTYVINWLNEICENISHFSKLIKSEISQKSVPMTLSTLKNGFLSPNDVVAYKTLNFHNELVKNHKSLKNDILSYFKQEGFKIMIEGIFDKQNLHRKLFEFFINIGSTKLFDIINEQIPKIINANFLHFLFILCDYLAAKNFGIVNRKKHRKELKITENIPQILKFLIEKFALFVKNNEIYSPKIILNLTILWPKYRKVIENELNIASQILEIFRINLRSTTISLKIYTVSNLFRLLSKFAFKKKPFAPVIYRGLAHFLADTENCEIRNFVIQNFIQFFNDFKNVPISMFLIPYANQLKQKYENLLNLGDLELLRNIAEYPKIDVNSISCLLEICKEIIFHSIVFNQHALKICAILFYKSRENPTITEFMKSAIINGLELLYDLIKKQAEKSSTKVIYFRVFKYQSAENYHEPVELQAQIKGIIEYLNDIITVTDNEELLENYYDNILDTNMKIKKILKRNYEPLYALLQFKGDPEEIIKNYEESLKPLENISRSEYSPNLVNYTNTNESRRLSISNDNCSLVEYSHRTPDQSYQSQAPSTLRISTKLPNPGESFDSSIQNHSELVPLSICSQANSYRISNKRASSNIKYSMVPHSVHFADSASQKAVLDIERIRRSRIAKDRERQNILEANKFKETKKQQELRFQLTRRMLQQGIVSKTSCFSDTQTICPFDSLNGQASRKSNLLFHPPEIKLLDFEAEEERDFTALKIVLEKYKKVLHCLFNSYANSGFAGKNPDFDNIKEQADLLSLGELTKMLKEHEINENVLSKDEIAILVRLVNQKIKRNDVISLNFIGFKEFFVQAAFYIYTSKCPNNQIISNNEIVDSFLNLIQTFGNAATKNNTKHAQLLKNPEITALGDPDILRELNSKFLTTPNLQIPVGYCIKETKNVNFNFQITIPNIKENTIICTEILDEILHEKFGFHFLENRMKIDTIRKIAPKIVKPLKKLIPVKFLDGEPLRKIKHNIFDPPIIRGSVSTGATVRGKPLPGTIKLSIALLPKNLQEIGYEVGEIMDDILNAVENNETKIIKKKKMNWGEKQRLEYESEIRKSEILKDQKRILRHKYLKRIVNDFTQKSMTEAKQTIENNSDFHEKREKSVLDQQILLSKKREEIRRSVNIHKQKRQEEMQKLREKEAEERKKEEAEKARIREAFLKKRKEEIVIFIKIWVLQYKNRINYVKKKKKFVKKVKKMR